MKLREKIEQLDETQEPRGLASSKGCPVCGGKLASIRGRYPHTDRRQVCPTCATEKLEHIRDITDRHYGVASTAKEKSR